MAICYLFKDLKDQPVAFRAYDEAGGSSTTIAPSAQPHLAWRLATLCAAEKAGARAYEANLEPLGLQIGARIEIPGKAKAAAKSAVAHKLLAPTVVAAKPAGPPAPPNAQSKADAAEEPSVVPERTLTKEQLLKLSGMEMALNHRIKGQADAVEVVCRLVRDALLGLKDEGKPDGVVIFGGPSGVGKTELAKAVAEYLGDLFGGEYPLLKYDMSEYQERHERAKLTGSPNGYVNSNEGGQLTNDIAKNPLCLVLLDEIGLAHASVLAAMLPAFDEGRLKDARGKLHDVSRVLFIGTANWKASEIKIGQRKLGFHGKDGVFTQNDVYSVAIEGFREQMPPQLRGRIDEVIVFKPLDETALKEIARDQLDVVAGRARRWGLDVTFTAAALDTVVAHNRDPLDGARHIPKAVKRLVNPVIGPRVLEMRLNGEETSTLTIDSDGSRLVALPTPVVKAERPALAVA